MHNYAGVRFAFRLCSMSVLFGNRLIQERRIIRWNCFPEPQLSRFDVFGRCEEVVLSQRGR